MRLISNEKGVTMMSLVITVTIMVILTAVSLNGVFGEGSKNSLVERAKNAKYKAEIEDLKDFWEAKLVDVDTTYLNYASLEDVMDEEQIPESLRGVLAVKQGKLVYKDDMVDDSKKEILKEFEIYSRFVDPIEISIKAKIKKVTLAKSADVIAVIDASSSMSYSPKYKYKNITPALNALFSIVLEANENNRVGVVSFASRYNKLLELSHHSKVDPTKKYVELQEYSYLNHVVGIFNIAPKISDYTIYSGTNLTAGIAKAEQMFRKRTAEEKEGKNDYIILLADGDPGYTIKKDSYSDIDTYFEEDKNSGLQLKSYSSIAGNVVEGVYNTVRYINTVKENHDGDLKIYTINYSNSKNSKVVMEPSDENINSNISSSEEYYDDLLEQENYATKAYSDDSDNFGEEELKNIFSEIGYDIIKRDETVFDMDTAEKVGDVIIENKMQFYDDNGKLVDYVLDEAEGDVVINVNAAVFVPTGKTDSSGNIIRAADDNRKKTYSKSYTIEEIKSGADPNIKYENGNIVWNIESDFDKNSTNNIKAEAINSLASTVTYDSSIGEEIGIKDVEIILPLVTYVED